MDTKRLLRAQLAVAALAVGGIALFLFLWAAMGDTTPAATRLFTSMLVPPLVITIIVGGYFLARRR
jgi:hypothetical protein